jgi:hypothetical protein
VSKERIQILDRLAEGQISTDEAEQQLLTLNEALPENGVVAEGRWSLFNWLASLFGARKSFEEQQDWSLDGAGVSTIWAQTDNGSIALDGTEQEGVTVRSWKKVQAPSQEAARAFAQQVQIHVDLQEGEVRIYKEHPRPPFGTSVSVRYEIAAPRQVGANLRTSNGAIRIREIDGPAEAETSNGSVELQGGTGAVRLRTSNGHITVEGVAGRVQAETSNGKIRAALDAAEEGVFGTSNGSIEVEVRGGNPPIAAKTSNGSVRLTLPPDFSGRLDARATHGHVHAALSLNATERSRHRLVGELGAGGEATVKLRTLNGSIHLSALAQG